MLATIRGASRRLSTVAVVAVSIAAGFGATAARADTFQVYVGYADNLRPSGFFPSPWIGDWELCRNRRSLSHSTGAVLVVNTGATALNISTFSVTMNGGGGPTYNFWSPITIGVGQSGVFTQTSSYNFDSSDNAGGSPPGGILPLAPGGNGIGGCSSTAAAQATAGITATCNANQPIVAFMDNATSFSFNDTGHILDTGLYDFVNYSPDGNESINWNLVGSGADRGGTNGVPEPSTWVMMLAGFAGSALPATAPRARA